MLINEGGTLQERLSFDGHGNRRNGDDWRTAITSYTPATTTTGFTGHEHLDPFKLIHMNGRVYDPQMGRFIQADPMLDQGIQGLNRYSYALNNPLTFTDPSGYSSWNKWIRTAAAIVVTIYTGGAATGAWSFFGTSIAAGSAQAFAVVVAGGFTAGSIQSGSVKGGLYGAFGAAAFFGVGTAFQNAQWANTGNQLNSIGKVAKTVAHGLTGGVMSDLQGGKFGHGFVSAGATQALSGGIDRLDSGNVGFSAQRTIAAAALGGSVSALTGGKFANGAVTAAFSRAFNDEAVHNAQSRRALLMVGDPGLGRYNAGQAFMLAAETEASALREAGWATEIVRVSSMDDMLQAITAGSQIDRAYFFGHGGVGALFPGESSGAGTNLYASDLVAFGPGRLSPTAEVYLYACNTGVGTSNIANSMSYYLQRPVFGFSSGLHYTGNSSFIKAPPYLPPPSSSPMYMRHDNGVQATKFDAYRGR